MALTAIIAIVGVVASVAGTVYSAISSKKAGEEAKDVAQMQAASLTEQAAKTQEQANVKEEQEREKARKMLASQRARIGASGVTMEGSPLLGMMETQAQYEKDLVNIKKGYQWELSDIEKEKQGILATGEAYEKAGEAKAGSTLLTGLGNLGTTWYSQYRKSMG